VNAEFTLGLDEALFLFDDYNTVGIVKAGPLRQVFIETSEEELVQFLGPEDLIAASCFQGGEKAAGMVRCRLLLVREGGVPLLVLNKGHPAAGRIPLVVSAGERIALSGPEDELRELADTFDRMLVRLDGAFASQRRFVANASRELRTPLAIMRTEVDVALADPDASGAELRAMGEAVRETIDRCEHLIESLLTLARSEAASGRGEIVDLAAMAGDCITDLRARAHDADVRLSPELEPAWTSGQPALLERMIGNLIENGIQHNERGGYMGVSTCVEGGRARLEVVNGGPPIDPADSRTLTEPFRRLDRGSEGFGLGLSIVRSVVAAHGGAFELEAPGSGGLAVRVALPAAPAPADANVGVSQTSRALTRS
jgi:signal transduction histidine kinase